MTPPEPLEIYRSGVRNTIEVAMLWILCQRGARGIRRNELLEILNSDKSTVRSAMMRLIELGLTTRTQGDETRRNASWWVITKKGYRLMTGQMKSAA